MSAAKIDIVAGPPVTAGPDVLHITTPEQADETFGAGSELAETAKDMIYAQRGELPPKHWARGATACQYHGRATRIIECATFTMADGSEVEMSRWSANGRWFSEWSASRDAGGE